MNKPAVDLDAKTSEGIRIVNSVVIEERPANLTVHENKAVDVQRDARIKQLAATIDPSDTQSIISFGVEAQKEVTRSADRMLVGVKNKDVGPVGDILNSMVSEIRGFNSDNAKSYIPGFVRRIIGLANPIAKYVQRYETVQKQITNMSDNLSEHRTKLLQDINMLDDLYDKSLTYFHDLELYIEAGKLKLNELDTIVIPALKDKATTTQDMLDAQNLNDMMSRRSDLDRKVHDLMLTRQVTMQSLVQIRTIQDVDKSMVDKIQNAILTTIPLWKSQTAMAITLANQAKAIKFQRHVTDTTNQMLEQNAKMLQMNNATARKEVERGIFDIESIKKANQNIVTALEEAIQIAAEGNAARRAAEKEMVAIEDNLKTTLKNTAQGITSNAKSDTVKRITNLN